MPATAPAAARPAATVVVLREAADAGAGAAGAPEVLLLRRHARSGFAADSWVFPGGVVDPADALLAPQLHRGVDPLTAAARFAATPGQTLAFHVAAVRETFEEAGLLFARRGSGAPVGPAVARRLRADAAGDLTGDRFAAMLAAEGLVADLGALTYLSRWVTPVVEPRRYDTCFFLARAPRGQVAGPDLVETTDRRWTTPATALAEHRAGRLRMMFPTVRTLRGLAEGGGVGDLISAAAAQPEVRSVLPTAVVDDSGRVVALRHPDELEAEPVPV